MSESRGIENFSQTLLLAKEWLVSGKTIIPFLENPRWSSFLVTQALNLEIGGPNDNLATHIRDAATGSKIEKADFTSEIVESNGLIGLRVTHRLQVPIRLTHAGLSEIACTDDLSITFFPERIAKGLAENGIEPVLVRDWLVSCSFSDFNPWTTDYRAQMSELINNDAFLYSKLVSNRQMVFQSLHDIIQHSTHARSEGWVVAQQVASEIVETFDSYFGRCEKGNIPSHILPFIVGILLDDLTQSQWYGSPERINAINELLKQISKLEIDPASPKVLTRLPECIEQVFRLARAPTTSSESMSKQINQLVDELYAISA
jgi:hypothetical protein